MTLRHAWIGWGLAGVMMTVVAGAAETNTVAGRVGVYDSRAVAYAWFVSEAQMAKLQAQMAAAKAEKEAGDAKFQADAAALKAKQEQMHREVFSTAPADEATAVLAGKIPEIERAAGVGAVVSKWDEDSLGRYRGAETVDVTDALVRALGTPTDKQLKTIESIEKSTPLPLKECNELIRKGKI